MAASYKGYKIQIHYNSYDILNLAGLTIYNTSTILEAKEVIDQLERV